MTTGEQVVFDAFPELVEMRPMGEGFTWDTQDRARDIAKAREIHFRLLPLHKQLFCESSPAPTKWALSQMGRCRNVLRLPIVELSAAGQATVGQALRESGIL